MRAKLAVGLAILWGCAGEAPSALTVGPVSFTADEVIGLSPSRLETLALVTGLGLAVADSTTEALGAPLVEEWTRDRLLQILAAELTLEKHGVGEEELTAAYAADPEWELTVEHVLVYSERWRPAAHREAAAMKAETARALLESGLGFPEVEVRLREVPGAEARAGSLPPGREGAWVPEFWAAALALEPGALSPVTETQYGFHVLRLQDRAVVPFAGARSAVARRVAATLERPGAVLEAWMSAAAAGPEGARAAALDEARRRGLEVPEAERAELGRTWEDRTATWAAALGLAYGLTPPEVHDAALTALARTGQEAELARRAIAEHAEQVRGRYDVVVGTGRPASP